MLGFVIQFLKFTKKSFNLLHFIPGKNLIFIFHFFKVATLGTPMQLRTQHSNWQPLEFPMQQPQLLALIQPPTDSSSKPHNSRPMQGNIIFIFFLCFILYSKIFLAGKIFFKSYDWTFNVYNT